MSFSLPELLIPLASVAVVFLVGYVAGKGAGFRRGLRFVRASGFRRTIEGAKVVRRERTERELAPATQPEWEVSP